MTRRSRCERGWGTQVFDSFECAIHALALTCAHCGCRVIGHGVEANGRIFCCAHCAGTGGRARVLVIGCRSEIGRRYPAAALPGKRSRPIMPWAGSQAPHTCARLGTSLSRVLRNAPSEDDSSTFAVGRSMRVASQSSSRRIFSATSGWTAGGRRSSASRPGCDHRCLAAPGRTQSRRSVVSLRVRRYGHEDPSPAQRRQ